MHTAHLANVSKSVTKNATFPRTGGLPCLITLQLHLLQLLGDSFSVSQQPPSQDPCSHYTMVTSLEIQVDIDTCRFRGFSIRLVSWSIRNFGLLVDISSLLWSGLIMMGEVELRVGFTKAICDGHSWHIAVSVLASLTYCFLSTQVQWTLNNFPKTVGILQFYNVEEEEAIIALCLPRPGAVNNRDSSVVTAKIYTGGEFCHRCSCRGNQRI